MEKENEVLLTTDSGVYYEGIPSTSTIEKSEDNLLEGNVVCQESLNNGVNSAGGIINSIVGSVLTITQVVFVIVGILCIFKGILNYIKNKQIITNKNDESNELNQNPNNLDNEGKIGKKYVLIYFIISGALFWISFVISISKKFAVKPIIYIYPEKETEVKVKVKNPEKLTCTYPKYENEWNVLAKPNGDLVDLKTNRKFYALYWEGINTTKSNLKEGFIVEGENAAKFLEEKLEILGLNEREAEEFIVYWLPLMEKNKYNYIRFETKEEIDENMELEITPSPETLIRINMQFKGLRKPISVEEQKLEKVERKGYTVVEWGGTRL